MRYHTGASPPPPPPLGGGGGGMVVLHLPVVMNDKVKRPLLLRQVDKKINLLVMLCVLTRSKMSRFLGSIAPPRRPSTATGSSTGGPAPRSPPGEEGMDACPPPLKHAAAANAVPVGGEGAEPRQALSSSTAAVLKRGPSGLFLFGRTRGRGTQLCFRMCTSCTQNRSSTRYYCYIMCSIKNYYELAKDLGPVSNKKLFSVFVVVIRQKKKKETAVTKA